MSSAQYGQFTVQRVVAKRSGCHESQTLGLKFSSGPADNQLMVRCALVAVLGALSVATPVEARRPMHAASADGQSCTPGYDPCIAPGPDVDCAGGRGNGPRYIEGPVRVWGDDPYDLDRDGDGVGCE